MKRKFLFIFSLMLFFPFLGCGYSTRSNVSSNLRTIYIEDFENKIIYTTESNRNVYIPLLELNVRNAVIDRFLFDGNLKVTKVDNADLILKGKLLSYQRDVLRYTDDEDAWEYRISIIVSLELWNQEKNELVWSEGHFAGDTEYFISGTLAKSEETAIDEAIVDLARRVVERTIEDW